MKKKIYICDICDQQFQTNPRGHRSFVGLEIHLKYETDVSHKVLTRMHICPRCLDQIRQNSREGEVDWKSIPVDVSEALKQRAVEKAKVEVAREIFEEIKKLKHTKFDWSDVVDWDGIAELEKKYIKKAGVAQSNGRDLTQSV